MRFTKKPPPAIRTASAIITEQAAVALSDAMAGDALLSTVSVDISETAPGKWRFVAYFPEAPTKAALGALKRLAGPHVAFEIEKLPETDWVAKSLEGLKPVRAGRFLIHGRHDRDQRRVNDVGIEIEAGQAFGTGHHGTTSACLMAIDRVVRTFPIANALDIGTGSGVLAIAIARTTRARVLASDIDPVAVAVAQQNVRLNGVADRVRCVTVAGLEGRVFWDRTPFDLIVANILAEPLVALAPRISAHLAPGGVLILSGLLVEQFARINSAYRAQGIHHLRTIVVEGWLTVTMERRMRRKKTVIPAKAGNQ